MHKIIPHATRNSWPEFLIFCYSLKQADQTMKYGLNTLLQVEFSDLIPITRK